MSGTRLPRDWSDLTELEQGMLRRMNTGATALITPAQVTALIARGLAEQRLTGPGLSPLGRDIFARMVAAMRKAKA